MATFIQEEKKQKILFFIFIASVLIIFVILWSDFRQKRFLLSQKKHIITPFQVQEIKIDWQTIFENSNSTFKKLEEKLQPFEKIKEFEGTPGRTNPFILY